MTTRTRKTALQLRVARCRQRYREAVARDDVAAALAALQEESQMLRLYPTPDGRRRVPAVEEVTP